MNRVATVVFLCAIACCFFLRCRWHEPSGDELIYQYVWEQDDSLNLWQTGHRFERTISSWQDIVDFQQRHYLEVNGRTLVHTAEQLFIGQRGLLAFSAINTAIFLLFALLVIRVSTRHNASFAMWVLAVLALLYLFPMPDSIWTSVNYGINYLWPATCAMAYLWLWQQLENKKNPVLQLLGALIAFVCGWSNEAFAIGMAGGTAIYLYIHRKQLPARLLWLAIPLFAGTLVTICAPGNFLRFTQHGQTSLYMKICNGVWVYLHLKLVWLALIAVAVLWKKKRMAALAASGLEMAMLGVTVAFTLVANTAPNTGTFAELLCLILILRILSGNKWLQGHNRIANATAVAVAMLIVVQQAVVCRDCRRIQKFQQHAIAQYVDSPDGTVCYDPPYISPLSAPFIRQWELPSTSKNGIYWLTINNVYGKGNKPTLFIAPAEYDAVSNPSEFFTKDNLLPGDAGGYYRSGGVYVWFKEPVTGIFKITLGPDNHLSGRLKRLFAPDAEPDAVYRWVDNQSCIDLPQGRSPIAVDIVDNNCN